MKFYSTGNREHLVSFEEAVFRSLPPDNGLYFPVNIPQFDQGWVSGLGKRPLAQSAFEVIRQFTGSEIDDTSLFEITRQSIDFDLPVLELSPEVSVLELYHGPTWAFKDVGARFLARAMGYFTAKSGKEITILVATSGDTGGAVAAGFHKIPGTQVKILYPKGKVSAVQEKQLTTLGHNIKAYEVEGTFDDCQDLVKKAFLDSELNRKFNLSSANSINVARLLPQTFYFLTLYAKMKMDGLVVAVPSGNYGNLTAGLLTKKMGVPFGNFIAASNLNKVVPVYLDTTVYAKMQSIQTYSNAMDVGNPSNFVRMQELYQGSHEAMKKNVKGFWLDDSQTISTMKNCYDKHGYVLDPHGAIGYAASEKYLAENPGSHVAFLETAHPVKFQPVLDKVFAGKINYPEKTASLMDQPSQFESISADFGEFRDRLLKA